MDMAQAARSAVEGECARGGGGGYRYGERDCLSLVEALCAAAGLPAPDYAPYRALSEGRAAGLAMRTHGSFGASHRAVLADTGRWQGWEGEAAPAPADGDVVSVAGKVAYPYGAYTPAREGMELTGIVAAGQWWTWQPWGLAGLPLDGLPVSHLSRAV